MTNKRIRAAAVAASGLTLTSIIGVAAPGSATPDLAAPAHREPAATSESGPPAYTASESPNERRATRLRGRRIRARLLADGATSQQAAVTSGGWIASAGRGGSRLTFRADVQQHLMATWINNELNHIQGIPGAWSVLPRSAVAQRALDLLNQPAAKYEFTAATAGEASDDVTSLLALVRDEVKRAPARSYRMHTTRGGRTYRIPGGISGGWTELRFDPQGVLRRWVVGGATEWARGGRLRIEFAYTPTVVTQPGSNETVPAADFGRAMVAADLRGELRAAILHGPVAALPGAGRESPQRLLQRRARSAVSYFNGMNAGFDARSWTRGRSVFVAATNPYTSETVTLELHLKGRRIQVTDA